MSRNTIILLIIFTLSACNNHEQQSTSKPEIAVSVLPEEYFVTKIAGDQFNVNVMIPPGASPATYEPTPAQLASLSNTRLYLEIGYTGFEMAWMKKLTAINRDMEIVNLSEGIDLIMEKSADSQNNRSNSRHNAGIDPHTWLSPSNAKVIAQNIYEALSEAYPEQENIYHANLIKFKTEIDSLDRYITNELSDLKSRAFFTYHPSLSYFARDYKLEQYPLEIEGKTPSSAYMKSLVDMGRKKNIEVLFMQMQFDQKNAEVLAKEIDAEIVQINPLDPEWYSQMVYITDKLKKNLK